MTLATVPEGFQRVSMVGFPDRCLVLWLVTRDGTAEVLCFGRKRHYRKGGGCKHTEAFMAALLPEICAATRVVGWGGARKEGEVQQ